MWQPLRSSDADASAVNELLAGRTDAALADAQTAVSADPVSAAALWELSEIHVATGDRAAARADLVRATDRQPSNPETWQRLGEFDLRYHQPRLALAELDKAVAAGPDRGAAAVGHVSRVHRPAQRVRRSRGSGRSHRPPAPKPSDVPASSLQFDLRFHAPQAALAELQTAVALGAPAAQANPLIAKTQAALNAQHARAAAAARKAARRRSGR